MTLTSTISSIPLSGSNRSTPLPPDLLDGITDTLYSLAGPVARGDAICGLVREIYESVAWLGAGLDDGELASLRRVVDEADAHQSRLTSRSRPGSTPQVEAAS